jgi:hypothetical protein
MDISIEKNSDLLEFINSEKNAEEIDINKAYLYFNTCCCKTIIELDKKLKDLNDKCMLQEIVMGTQMFSHVFFVLLSYTNNLKLTIFLAERAILLYTEFIIMSNDKQVMKDVCYHPAITDPILFAYKKTIGPIPVNIQENTPEFNLLKSASLLIREIYLKYYELFNDSMSLNESHLDNLDTIEDTLSSRIIEVFSQIYTQENMNNLLSKKIFSFIQESSKEEFLDKIDQLADRLDKILSTLNDIDWVSDVFIEELFRNN